MTYPRRWTAGTQLSLTHGSPGGTRYRYCARIFLALGRDMGETTGRVLGNRSGLVGRAGGRVCGSCDFGPK